MTPTESAKAYPKGVTAGKIIANEFIRLACQRFLDDLKRKGADWPYKYDAEKADRAVRFMEKMPHTKGKWAAQKRLLVLEPWQRFIECNLFGWVHKKTGHRRFRRAYEEIPRKIAQISPAKERGARVHLDARKMWQTKGVWAASVDQGKRYAERWCAASLYPELRLRAAVARLVDSTPTELPPPMPGLPPTPEQLQQPRRLAEAGREGAGASQGSSGSTLAAGQ